MNKGKCLWKIVLENNLKGKGTSFNEPEKIICYNCNGYEFDNCKINSYVDGEDDGK